MNTRKNGTRNSVRNSTTPVDRKKNVKTRRVEANYLLKYTLKYRQMIITKVFKKNVC